MRAAILLLLLVAASARAGDPPIAQAIEQLMRDDGQVAIAERVLKALPDRAEVIAEAQRPLQDEKASLGGKCRVLQLVARLERSDIVTDALKSPVVSTRRAAAQVLAGVPDLAETANPILLAWIAEEPPPEPALLVEACRRAGLAEARPWLRKVLEAPDTPPPVFENALAALLAEPSPDLAEAVKKRLADPKEDPARIEACIDALKALNEMRADDLLLPWIVQREHRMARLKAVFAIRDPVALQPFLLDKGEDDAILQRNCLFRLMQVVDDADLLKLLRDPRVNRHKYFAIRVDVCTALAAIEGSCLPDVPLLLDYLVDEDPQDKGSLVRGEAWLTLWILTGKMHGALGEFAKPPARGGREYRATRMRPGVTREQTDAVYRLAKDLDHMRTVREAYAAAK